MFLWFGIYYSTARGFCKKHPLSPAKREKSLKKISLFPFTRQKLPGDALSVTAAAVPAPPKGEPSMCAAKSLRKAKSRLPLWGRWTRVSEDGEGKLPAAPSHGLCGSAGGLPSQSRLPPCQRLGCRLGRPLGNVPPGRSGPRRGSQVGTQPEVCRKPSLASPFGGGAPAGGGEGSPPPARTCAGLLMSTSGASCHGRELTAEALRRPGKALRCFPSFLTCAARL